MRWLRRLGIALSAVVLATGTVAAHQVTGTRFDSPLPLSLLFAGAGITIAVTAGWLAVPSTNVPSAWIRPILKLQRRTAARLRTGARIVFFLAFAAVIGAGTLGPQVPTENFAVVFTWSVWIKGVGLIAAVFGSPWRILSPWRTLYDGLVRLEGDQLAVLGTYPTWLKEWPALIGFLVWLGIVDNLTVVPRSPAATAGLVAGYAGVMVLGGVAFGPAWFRRADTLEVLYRLFGRVAPFQFRDEGEAVVLSVRTPWEACTSSVQNTVVAAFVIGTVYTVSFDGFTNTPEYQTLLFAVRDALGTGPEVSVVLYLVGFALFCVSFAVIVVLSNVGSETTGLRAGSSSPDRNPGSSMPDWKTGLYVFTPTVLPIAVAYEIAHNYPYVAQNLGRMLTILGEYLVATPPEVTLLAWLSLSTFWLSQVGLIVVGHVVAVVASHHVIVERYRSRRRALQAHVPLTALMIGYTILSLWIVSRPVVA